MSRKRPNTSLTSLYGTFWTCLILYPVLTVSQVWGRVVSSEEPFLLILQDDERQNEWTAVRDHHDGCARIVVVSRRPYQRTDHISQFKEPSLCRYGYAAGIISTTLGQPTFLDYFGLLTRSNANSLISAIVVGK